MRYHNITKADMLNGEGLRTVLWVAGCNHYCKGCQNPETWDACGGIPFDESAKQEIMESLEPDYIDGIKYKIKLNCILCSLNILFQQLLVMLIIIGVLR